MTVMILPDRLERFASIHLRSGKGNGANGNIDVCAMQAADWLAGGTGKNYHPNCVCPVIAKYVIRLNDSFLFENHRDKLKPFIPKIIGTVADLGVIVARAHIAAGYATEYAKYAGRSAKHAKFAANYAVNYAECSVKNPKYAIYAAMYTVMSAEYAANSTELQDLCLKCIDDMINAKG